MKQNLNKPVSDLLLLTLLMGTPLYAKASTDAIRGG